MIPQLVPILAYSFLASAAIPAIRRMWKNHSSKDVSLLWQSMILTGCVIIFSYALQAGDPVFIAGGILNIVSLSSVIIAALYFRR